MRRHTPLIDNLLTDLALILAFAGALAWPLVLKGQIPINGDWLLSHFEPWRTEGPAVPGPPPGLEPDDPITVHYPLALEAARQWRAGHWPLWNPHILCGTPLAADDTSLPYSPFMPLWMVLPGPWAWSAELFLQLCMAGAGAYLFARASDCARPAALIGAVAFMGHQGIVLWWELRFALGALCWLPWMLWASTRFRQGGSTRWLSLQALFAAFSLMGGCLQFAGYALGIALVLDLAEGRRLKGLRRWGPVLALMLGCVLAAVQILPTLALASESQRTPDRYAGMNALSPWHLLTFLMPEVFGHPGTGDFLGGAYTRPSMVMTHGGYLGLIPLALALASLRRGSPSRAPALLGLGILGGLLALGVPAVHGAVLALCPWFDAMDQVRALLAVSACLALAAPFGFAAETPRRGLCGAALGMAGLGIVGLIGWNLISLWQERRWLEAIARSGAASAGNFWVLHHLPTLVLGALALGLLSAWNRLGPRMAAGLAVGLVALDLGWFAQGYNPFTPPECLAPETPSIQALRSSATGEFRVAAFDHWAPTDYPPEEAWKLYKGTCLPPDAALLYPGLSDLRGKDSLYPERLQRFMQDLAGPGRATPFLSCLHTPPTESSLLDAAAVDLVLSPVPLAAPRFVRVSGSEALGVYRNTQALPRARLEGSDTGPLPPVHWLRDDPRAVDLKAHAPGPCRLVLADSWDSGWEAWVDGQPTPIEEAYGIFRAVPLQTGLHRVSFRYRPLSSLIGLWLSLTGLLAGLLTFFGVKLCPRMLRPH